MAIDTSLQYRGHNSFYLQPNQRWISNLFAVQNMPYITHSFWAMASRTLTSDIRARTRLYNSDGMQLAVLPHQFSLGTLWDFVELPMAVSAGAYSAQLEFVAGADGFWFVEPKSETGQTATPYNINYAGQLSKISPTGAYFGLLHANQIILTGSLADPDQTLDGEILKINNKQISLENSLTQKTTRIDSSGVYTGRVKADQITTGRLESQNGQSWLDMDNGRFSFGNGALTWSGSELTVTGKFRSQYSASKPTRVEIDSGRISIVNNKGTEVGVFSNASAAVLEGLNINTGVGSKYLSFGHFIGAGSFLVDYFINHGENPRGRTEKHVFIGDGYYSGNLTAAGSVTATQFRSHSYSAANGQDRIKMWDGGTTELFYGSSNVQRVQIASNSFLIKDHRDNIRLRFSDDVTVIRNRTQNLFYGDGSGTWVSSPDGQTHILIGNNAIQLIRNNTVIQQW